MMALLTDMTPVLPALWVMTLARNAGWALVLACLVLRGWLGAGYLPLLWRRALAGVLVVAAVLPGALGLGYWLGLAFQIPSLTTMGLALVVVFTRWSENPQPVLKPRAVLLLSAAAVVLGWVMLLDTLALLPWFIYPWGYGTGAVAVLLALALAFLLIALPASRSAGFAAVLLAAVFALTRLPSGNLWDALSDPLLWLFAHGVLVRALWQRGHSSAKVDKVNQITE